MNTVESKVKSYKYTVYTFPDPLYTLAIGHGIWKKKKELSITLATAEHLIKIRIVRDKK